MQYNMHEIFQGGLEEFETILSVLTQNIQYNYVYVSIGGKINERRVDFYPSNKTAVSNADNQLIPEFLKYRESKQILIIAIDNFLDKDSYEINKKIINKNKEDNMSVILFHQILGDLTFIDSFIQILISFLHKHNIHENNFMICNYIKFKAMPNAEESRLLNELPLRIHNALIKTKYSACLFEWYGYHFYTFNLIYNYKKYQLYIGDYRNMLQHFETCSLTCPFNINNDFEILKIQNMYHTHFCKYSYDITSYIADVDEIALPINHLFRQFLHTSLEK